MDRRKHSRLHEENSPKWDRRKRNQRVPEWFWVLCLLAVAIAASALDAGTF